MKKLILLILVVIFTSVGFGSDETQLKNALDLSNLKVGAWVEYSIQVEENQKEKIAFTCFIKLYGINGDMLDFEYKINGIGKRIEIARNDFPLARLVPKISRATSYKDSTEEKYVFTDMENQEVETIHDIWNYENGVTEVWHSKEVPFSVVRVACKGFTMELRAFSWAEE